MGNKILDFYCDLVLTGKVEFRKVYESDNVLAFYHTKPAYEKHIVIIPKKHIDDLIALKPSQDKIILEIIGVAKKLASKFDFKKEGVRLITNMGIYQDSRHLHFHLVSGDRIK